MIQINKKEFGQMTANEIASETKDEIEDLDKRIDAMGLELPEKLTQTIQQDILHNKTKLCHKNNFRYCRKIAVYIAIVFMGICVFNPKVTMAIKNVVYELFSIESKESIDIKLEEEIWKKYTPYIPNGFELETQIDNVNLTKKIYTRSDYFISISISTKEYYLSLDNENLSDLEEIKINTSKGKKMVRNQVTTIVFPFNNYIFEVESNLSEQETMDIAKSINKEQEN